MIESGKFERSVSRVDAGSARRLKDTAIVVGPDTPGLSCRPRRQEKGDGLQLATTGRIRRELSRRHAISTDDGLGLDLHEHVGID